MARSVERQGGGMTAAIVEHRVDVTAEFREHLRVHGIETDDHIVADDRVRRVRANGEQRSSVVYRLRDEGDRAFGWTRDHRSGETHPFRSTRSSSGTLTAAERRSVAERVEARRRKEEAEQHERHERVARRAEALWTRCADEIGHPYLERKGVARPTKVYRGSFYIGRTPCDGAMVAPMRDIDGRLWGLQFVFDDGRKLYLPGARKKGTFARIRFPKDGSTPTRILIAEGIATAFSVVACVNDSDAMGIAFDASNLLPVARAIRDRFPGVPIILCADDDTDTQLKRGINPGIEKATDAARAVGGLIAVPDFGEDRPPNASDMNDLHQHAGLDAVRACIDAAQPVAAVVGQSQAQSLGTGVENGSDVNAWPEPDPLIVDDTSLPYPVDALPPILRDAVNEALEFTQAPPALAVCSALCALSIAAQGLVNVRRDAAMVGPVSIYTLAVADSGERKSTCDSIFSRALKEHERTEQDRLAPDVARARALHDAWESKRDGKRELLKQLSRKGQSTSEVEEALAQLSQEEPASVIVPRLVYGDVTPESLAHSLATGWPSAGVLSAEGGSILGSHGMGADTLMRNLAVLNALWSGEDMPVDRRTSASFVLRNRRLSFGLMVQPSALAGFLERSGTLPRGTGFLARFLPAWPDSTQGTRLYREAPERMPAVDRFSGCVTALLRHPLTLDERGGLVPTVLALDRAASKAWAAFHDDVERELGAAGGLRELRDFGSKAAEQAARIAALFHVAEHGIGGTIRVDTVERACAVVEWHLGQARRLVSRLDMPTALANAVRLDEWLTAEARRCGENRVPRSRIAQFGPSTTREKKALGAALDELVQRGRVRQAKNGRQIFVEINSVLLTGDTR